MPSRGNTTEVFEVFGESMIYRTNTFFAVYGLACLRLNQKEECLPPVS